MRYEVKELGCSVERDVQTREPKVILSFEEASDEFVFALSAQEATELAALIESLAAEARLQPVSQGRH